jgi:hypothetical protein
MQQVNHAVLMCRSAAGLSRDIRPALVEPYKLFRRVRGKDGKLRLSKAAKAYRPGRGVYRSSYANALRLSRTEMARAFTEGQIRHARAKSWVDGVIFRNGNAEACPICSDLDTAYFKVEDAPQIPIHPNCMCYLENHVKHDPKPPARTFSIDTRRALGLE